jgi:hypothetical protein
MVFRRRFLQENSSVWSDFGAVNPQLVASATTYFLFKVEWVIRILVMKSKRLACTSSDTANELPTPSINNEIIISILSVIPYVFITSLISANAISAVCTCVFSVITSEKGLMLASKLQDHII